MSAFFSTFVFKMNNSTYTDNPQTSFASVIGQEAMARHVISIINGGRLPHALLICGPSGSGKLAFALALARYVCCTNPSDTDGCGCCPSCRMADLLEHPDIHYTFPVIKKKDGKETVSDDWLPEWRKRIAHSPYFSLNDWSTDMGDPNKQPIIYKSESLEIQRKLSLKSSQGGYKVSIIWLPEKMNAECGNKLLKLVEEPPEKTLFIFVSEEPEYILPTLAGRMQRLNLQPIAEDTLTAYFTNQMGLTPDDAVDVARRSEGSLLKALQNISLSEEDKACFESFISLMRLAYKRDIRSLKDWSDQMAGRGRERQKHFLSYAGRMIRESFMANFHSPELNYMNREETQFTVRFAPFINERNIMGIDELLEEALSHIIQNVNAKMVFFDLAVRMIVYIKNR